MRRTCPRDQTQLDERRVERVNVDICPKCAGIFFDGVEIRRVTGDADLALSLAEARGAAESPLACPACGEHMHLDKVGELEIDHCASCLGIWLDAGETERIVARKAAAEAAAATPAPTHQATVGETLRRVAFKLRGGD